MLVAYVSYPWFSKSQWQQKDHSSVTCWITKKLLWVAMSPREGWKDTAIKHANKTHHPWLPTLMITMRIAAAGFHTGLCAVKHTPFYHHTSRLVGTGL